jgi:hypothetical protein
METQGLFKEAEERGFITGAVFAPCTYERNKPQITINDDSQLEVRLLNDEKYGLFYEGYDIYQDGFWGELLSTPKPPDKKTEPQGVQGLVIVDTPVEVFIENGRMGIRIGGKEGYPQLTWNSGIIDTDEVEVLKDFVEKVYRVAFSHGASKAINNK